MDEVDAVWGSMVVALAGNLTDQAGGSFDMESGSDIDRAVRAAAALISARRLPAGVECAITIDGLLVRARMRAGDLLAEHAGLVDNVADSLLEAPAGRLDWPTIGSYATA